MMTLTQALTDLRDPRRAAAAVLVVEAEVKQFANPTSEHFHADFNEMVLKLMEADKPIVNESHAIGFLRIAWRNVRYDRFRRDSRHSKRLRSAQDDHGVDRVAQHPDGSLGSEPGHHGDALALLDALERLAHGDLEPLLERHTSPRGRASARAGLRHRGQLALRHVLLDAPEPSVVPADENQARVWRRSANAVLGYCRGWCGDPFERALYQMHDWLTDLRRWGD